MIAELCFCLKIVQYATPWPVQRPRRAMATAVIACQKCHEASSYYHAVGGGVYGGGWGRATTTVDERPRAPLELTNQNH